MIIAARIWLIGVVFLAGPAAAAEIVIGTGGETGVYWPVGRTICRLVNEGTASHGVSCEAIPTEGSVANLQALRAGALQLAVVQSDWQYHAVQGTSVFAAAGPDPELRGLFSVHGEPFTVVARRDAGFAKLDDLKGGRVNLGNPGSGQRATMEVVMAAKGWSEDDFLLAEALPASQQSLALCHGRIQAMVYTVGHPNASIGQAAGLCDAVILEVKDAAIDKLVAENPFYAYTEVPGGVYPGNPDPVTTFGVKATVVSSATVEAEVIHAVVAAVFDNLDRFKLAHPAFGALDPGTMVTDALSAPLHPGAEKYYEEAGLM
ncbi:MAG TPA: TAXI family TRAP transporter solute-binding subunit [Geminicoccaceae bacterium]|nr:TAXI family TRAP transporter solute-binding subunit [Geminicoccaceae bacterium]